METCERPRRGNAWFLLIIGWTFLGFAAFTCAVEFSGENRFQSMSQVLVSFSLIGSVSLLLRPVASRMERFDSIPDGQRKETWVEGSVVAPSRGVRRFLLGVDRLRMGVDGSGLRIRRWSPLPFPAIFWISMWIVGSVSKMIPAVTRSVDGIGLILLCDGLPALLGLAAFALLDSSSSRSDALHSWTAVGRIIETKDALFIHWADGSAPLVVEIPPKALRRILPQLAEHTIVDEVGRPTAFSVRTPAPRWPTSIDAKTADSLDEALDNLRHLED